MDASYNEMLKWRELAIKSEEQNKALTKDLQEAREENETLKLEKVGLEGVVLAYETKIEQLHKEIVSQKETFDALLKKYKDLEYDRDSYKESCNNLQKLIEEYETESAWYQKELKRLRSVSDKSKISETLPGNPIQPENPFDHAYEERKGD